MAIDRDTITPTDVFPRFHDEARHIRDNGNSLGEIIHLFLEDTKDTQNMQLYFARRQVISLYRRMQYHQSNKALCLFYENDILKIICPDGDHEKDPK